ncbi:uncharacterized protein LOC130813662 [Amaranthus tricolor]|uniref:uncharacterized protein LOC130813662 n=1 Tax=Amaranthus tricolor TaxID=29722 RepID=UPI0025897F51|nr:uncharacterized protein LOC130813662 [Amaranthus tricolor]
MACKEDEDRIEKRVSYKEAKRATKKTVTEAKSHGYEDLYRKLDTKEGEKQVIKLAKTRSRQRQDLDGYSISLSYSLSLGGNQIFDVQRPLEYRSKSDITTGEVREALKKMGRTKAVRLDNIPIEHKLERRLITNWRVEGSFRCGTAPVDEPGVSIDETIVKSTSKYKYLGSIIQRDEEIDRDVNHRIQAGWLKWRVATAVLCERKLPSKLKGKFYRAAIRFALLYGTEWIGVGGGTISMF